MCCGRGPYEARAASSARSRATSARSSGSSMTIATVGQSCGPSLASGWQSVQGWPGRSGHAAAARRVMPAAGAMPPRYAADAGRARPLRDRPPRRGPARACRRPTAARWPPGARSARRGRTRTGDGPAAHVPARRAACWRAAAGCPCALPRPAPRSSESGPRAARSRRRGPARSSRCDLGAGGLAGGQDGSRSARRRTSLSTCQPTITSKPCPWAARIIASNAGRRFAVAKVSLSTNSSTTRHLACRTSSLGPGGAGRGGASCRRLILAGRACVRRPAGGRRTWTVRTARRSEVRRPTARAAGRG